LKTIEDRLVKRGVVYLNSQAEGEMLALRYTELPSSRMLIKSAVTEKRSKPLCFVTGASGSGKTFFAIKQAATFGIKTPKATLYCQPAEQGKLTKHLTVDSLMEWVKKALSDQVNAGVPIDHQLQMHITLILDEAGSVDVKRFFEERDNLLEIMQQMRKLSVGIRLVICGTGVTGVNFLTKGVAYKFRMRKWSRLELDEILKKEGFIVESVQRDILDAIRRHPALNALSTNGRAAWFLTRAIADNCNLLPAPDSWVKNSF
jgi:hypothetical protein